MSDPDPQGSLTSFSCCMGLTTCTHVPRHPEHLSSPTYTVGCSVPEERTRARTRSENRPQRQIEGYNEVHLLPDWRQTLVTHAPILVCTYGEPRRIGPDQCPVTAAVWEDLVSMVRCVVFVSSATVQQYEALSHRVGESRFGWMRYALERGLGDVERFVRSYRPAAPLSVPDPGLSVDAIVRRRRGRPTKAERVRELATLEHLVQRNLQEAPHLDIDAVRRLVLVNAEAFLGAPPQQDLLEQALDRIFSQRAEEAPEPVGGNRPPE